MNMAAALARTVLASILAAGVVASDAPSAQYDVVVWACTPAGFAAALGAKAAGAKRVVVIEPTSNVGGMTAAGGIGLRDCEQDVIRTPPNNSTQYTWAMRNAEYYGVAGPVRVPQTHNCWPAELRCMCLRGLPRSQWEAMQLHSWHGMNHLAIACSAMKGHSRHSLWITSQASFNRFLIRRSRNTSWQLHCFLVCNYSYSLCPPPARSSRSVLTCSPIRPGVATR